MSKEYIYLLVGPSGAGKTTVANILKDEYKWRVLDSYTTRRPRFEGETGHTFCTKEEFDALPDKVASVEFDGNWYCATTEQVENSDIYVIDPEGIAAFFVKYHGKKIPVIVNLSISVKKSISRMRQRGDSEEKIVQRINNDIKIFWSGGKADCSVIEDAYRCLVSDPDNMLIYNADGFTANTIAYAINYDRDRRYEHEKIHCSD